MILKSIVSLDAALAQQTEYDASFFAAGYERRCTAVAKKMRRENLGTVVVSGFSEHVESSSRETADEYYRSLHPEFFSLHAASDYSYIGSVLKDVLSTLGNKRIFIDYSSMPRTWYGAVLNYLRSADRHGLIEVDFCYVPGVHEPNFVGAEVQGISTVPGFEGVSSGSARTTAIFSLGFERWTPYAALERVEPNEVICFIAEPGAGSEYTGRSREVNQQFFDEHASMIYEFDIRNVPQTFGFLSEMAALTLNSGCDVAMVGMGPKPHVLGMLLSAIRFPEIAVVQVRRGERGPRDVAPFPYEIVTRVSFEA